MHRTLQAQYMFRVHPETVNVRSRTQKGPRIRKGLSVVLSGVLQTR